MTVRVGVIGTGVMGADHAQLLGGSVHGAVLGAVHDLDAGRARAVAAGIPGARVLDSPLAVIKDADTDAVLVASPDETHEELVTACLDVGKPVLCEKPLAPTPAGCLRVVGAELAVGRRLVTVGFMRRYDDGYLDLKRVLDTGTIGAPLLMHCAHRNPSSPPNWPSDMVVRSSAVHEIDAARWLLGEEFVAVTCYGRRGGGLIDPQFLVLETESGVLVDVEVFVNARYGYDVRCELVGESGTATLRPPGPTTVRRDGAESTAVARDWRDRFAGAYRRELQDWVDGIDAREARSASAWDGYVATQVAQAAVDALGSGARTGVRLAERPPLYA